MFKNRILRIYLRILRLFMNMFNDLIKILLAVYELQIKDMSTEIRCGILLQVFKLEKRERQVREVKLRYICQR
jgi:hypothetical protein